MHFGIYVETREAWRTEGDTFRTMKTKVKSSVFMSARGTQTDRDGEITAAESQTGSLPHTDVHSVICVFALTFV